MLTNYIKIAFRNLRKQRGYALTNVAGLAIGLTCCLLIALYVRYEVSYDRFHQDADRIHRVNWFSENPQTRTPHPMAQALVTDFPEVESAVSLTPIWGPGLTRPSFSVRYADRQFEERGFLAVDSTFFDVLLSKDFTRLVLVAIVLAAPLAYLAMNRWLENFAFHVDMSGLTFLIAGLTALGIALLTVGYQALKAALNDPVTCLRYE